MDIGINSRNPPMVSIFCMVYNHEPFLKECLDGFIMQKCNFEFEIVIGEDCSKDKSREIIVHYAKLFPQKFKLILHEKNVGAAQNQKIVFTNCSGKYIAMCEGDDYWTDPNKLQKQIDFLEANPDYSFSFHDCTVLQENTKTQILRIGERQIDETPDLISVIEANNIPTASLVFRNLDLEKGPNWFLDITKGDYGLVVLLAEKGRGKYFHEAMSVYRLHDGGVWSSQNLEYVYQQDKIFYSHLLSYFEDYHVKKAVRKKINFTESNFGVYLIRKGNILKGLFKIFKHSKWFMDNGAKVDFRRILSAILQGSKSVI
jgi:glycosyltransferase involved in cell wall biosynthesis